MSVSNATYAHIVDYMRDHSGLYQLSITQEKKKVIETTGSAWSLLFKKA
jgi:hypothetical protein